MRFGEKIKVLREARNIDQGVMAEKIGVHQTTLSLWERGKRAFDADYLEPIAEVLDVQPELFMDKSPWAEIESARTHLDTVIRNILKEKGDVTNVSGNEQSATTQQSKDEYDIDDALTASNPPAMPTFTRELTKVGR